jgi:hypothetical protein
MSDKASEKAESEQGETAGAISKGEEGIEEVVEGDDAAEALGGTGIELIANAMTPLTIDQM